jgi:hypothetical protein
MTMQSISNGNPFDKRKAKKWDEKSSSRRYGEALYQSYNGRWIIEKWRIWVETAVMWYEIDADEAARWLVKNKYDPRLTRHTG